MFKLIILGLISNTAFGGFNFYKDFSVRSIDKDRLSSTITTEFFKNLEAPEEIEFDEYNLKVDYTFNKKLTDYIKKRLRYYRSDYASVVVIDNNTGQILSAIDYTRKNRTFGKDMTYASTHPAASVFKIITASNLIENTEVSKDTLFSYNGKSTTLYKYQLKNKKNRWTRKIPFSKAFAYSNNVVFGKAAINKSSYESLTNTANKFGFNAPITQIVSTGQSSLFMDKDKYGLAEMASGFNKKTLISPVHGAVIGSVIANDGIFRRPYIVEKIEDERTGRVVWTPDTEMRRVLSTETVQQMKDMMRLTVKRGTARGAFRPWKIRKIKEVEIGGKTGSITGGIPYGKRDWFVSYAMPGDDENDKGISVSVMIVNVKKWYVKSTVLAKDVIQYYYSRVKQ